MQPTTDGVFRVLASPRADDEFVAVDVETGEPTYVCATGYDDHDSDGDPDPDGDRDAGDDLADTVAALQPGNRVAATLAWDGDGTARFASLAIETETTVTFVDGATDIFEVATETWREARQQGSGVNSRVTRDTDGNPNGVVYTFAEQSGERDLYAEFRGGTRPLEPLIERLAEDAAPPFDVFVIRPAEERFVLVYLVVEKGGLLAETVVDSYV